MSGYQDNLIKAIKEASRRAGTQAALSEMSGVPQGRISDYLGGRYDVSNMALKTLYRLFPKLELDFFGECGHRVTAGDVYGGINQGGSVAGGIHVQNAGNQVPDALKTEIYAEVLERLMDCQELDDTVKVKIFKILKQKQ